MTSTVKDLTGNMVMCHGWFNIFMRQAISTADDDDDLWNHQWQGRSECEFLRANAIFTARDVQFNRQFVYVFETVRAAANAKRCCRCLHEEGNYIQYMFLSPFIWYDKMRMMLKAENSTNVYFFLVLFIFRKCWWVWLCACVCQPITFTIIQRHNNDGWC